MFRSSVAISVAFFCACGLSVAVAGSVAFLPSQQVVESGGLASFELHVGSEDLGDWDNLRLHIGSDHLEFDGYVWNPHFEASLVIAGVDLRNLGFYEHELSVYSLLNAGTDHVGVGTVSMSTEGLLPGRYEVVIDGLFDNGASSISARANHEAVSGLGVVTVIPEPASMALLAAGGLLLLNRKRRS